MHDEKDDGGDSPDTQEMIDAKVTRCLFHCARCGGDVVTKTGGGRTMEYRRGCPEMPIPDDFSIPTCAACGETYKSPDAERQLSDLLETSFRAWQKEHLFEVIHHIMAAHKATIAQVANVAGVTTQHLTAVANGDITVTVTLQVLLECFAASPELFTLHMLREDVVPVTGGDATPENETAPPSPAAINLSVAVKRLARDIRKAVQRCGFAKPSGELVDGGAVVLTQVFGSMAASFCRMIGGDLPLFLATMQVQYEEGADSAPDATKAPRLVRLK
jgi:hypothetical protein